MTSINLNNKNDIFSFLLSRNTQDCESGYLDSVGSLEKIVEDYVSEMNIENILDNKSNFNIDCYWINEKYKDLVKLKITLDLITNDIISFYEKK